MTLATTEPTTSSATLPSVNAAGQHPAARACAHDLLLMHLVDYRPFVTRIAAAARRHWGQPRMTELWCGTGRLAWPVLASVPWLDYLGVDPDAAMVRTFRRQTIRLATRRGEIRLEAPWDPRNPQLTTPNPLPGGANLVLVAHAFQGLPVVAGADGGRSQREMLDLLGSLLHRDGTAFIIEDVLGASPDEEEAFEWAADLAARKRLLPEVDAVAASLERWEDPRAKLVRRLPAQPGVIRELRASIRRFRDRNRLPLATWYRLAEVNGFHLHATPHPETPGLQLLALSRVNRAAA